MSSLTIIVLVGLFSRATALEALDGGTGLSDRLGGTLPRPALVCAFPGSALSHEWARRGLSAVRIAHRRRSDKVSKPASEPLKGRALTWCPAVIARGCVVCAGLPVLVSPW